ncbi:unnamed protein product [Trichobilharzia regenti]|nr:unnamed protein product [Trichobilharzia regenti]
MILALLVQHYNENQLSQFKGLFMYYHHLRYSARECYARTCAVMSMVGYVLGLGDRHTENILFDSTGGDLVHVDFSCVFNNGLTLPWPERVPFRLTRNMVHAMGPTGYEGTFRRCSEAVMHLLRREIDPLLAVFRPIYFDAVVEQGANVRGSPFHIGETSKSNICDIFMKMLFNHFDYL